MDWVDSVVVVQNVNIAVHDLIVGDGETLLFSKGVVENVEKLRVQGIVHQEYLCVGLT